MADLGELEIQLSGLSHNDDALKYIQAFSEQLSNTTRRIHTFNADHAFVRPAILSEDARALGFTTADDDFTLLQGDVVTSESAYFMGERVTGQPMYVTLNSSCDLVPDRRKYAALLRISQICKSEEDVGAKLNVLLRFKRRDAMYLPVLPEDLKTVVCNVIQFDGICQIKAGDLLLARRIASLSLVAWRIFGCFTRVVFARAHEREGNMRGAIERRPVQTTFEISD